MCASVRTVGMYVRACTCVRACEREVTQSWSLIQTDSNSRRENAFSVQIASAAPVGAANLLQVEALKC